MRKQSSVKFILFLILGAFFFRGLFLVGVFPIFKGQDESRHYNTIQYLSTGKNKKCQRDNEGKYLANKQDKRDLSTYRYSDEIRETASVVQHKQIRGNYYDKIDFKNNSLDGINETGFKKKQHSKIQHFCPPDVAGSAFGREGFSLYEWGLSALEKKIESQNIFVRYDLMRIISVILGAIMLWLAYGIFKAVGFSKKQSLILMTIISFQPKLATYFTNINYDVLLIPLWTGFVLVSTLIVKKGWNFKRGISSALIFILALITKPSALPLIGVVVYLTGRTFYIKGFKKQKINWFVAGLLVTGIGYASYVLMKKVGLTLLFSSRYLDSLGDYLRVSLSKINGSSANYWGAIGWDASQRTMLFVKTIWIIEWMAWLGLVVGVISPWIKKIKNKINFKLPSCSVLKNKCPIISSLTILYEKIKKQLQKNDFNLSVRWKKYFWLMLVFIFVLQLGIRVADWKVFTNSGGLDLGTPGRYWLPNIVPHFVLLAMGLKIITGFFRSKTVRTKYFELSLLGFLVLMVLYWCYEVFDVIIPRFYL